MGGHKNFNIPGFATVLRANKRKEGGLFYPAMHARFFEGFQCRRLGRAETGLGISFRERPPSATRLHQKKLDNPSSNPEANGGHFFTAPQRAQIGEVEEFGCTM